MRILTGLAIAVTLMILAYIIRRPALRLVFARDLPETPEGWEPRMRTWIRGVEQ